MEKYSTMLKEKSFHFIWISGLFNKTLNITAWLFNKTLKTLLPDYYRYTLLDAVENIKMMPLIDFKLSGEFYFFLQKMFFFC